MKTTLSLVLFATIAAAQPLSAACMNKFVARTERPKQVVTLLTGKLTFQEAKALAKAIDAKSAPPLEWVDDNGRVIARQMGSLDVVRPMPVGCDGKSSGVVIIASFLAVNPPVKKMNVRLDPQTTVLFEQQAN